MALQVKNLPDNAGGTRDMSLSPGQEDSPGEGNGNPPQCSCLENLMVTGAWWSTDPGVAKSEHTQHTSNIVPIGVYLLQMFSVWPVHTHIHTHTHRNLVGFCLYKFLKWRIHLIFCFKTGEPLLEEMAPGSHFKLGQYPGKRSSQEIYCYARSFYSLCGRLHFTPHAPCPLVTSFMLNVNWWSQLSSVPKGQKTASFAIPFC